MEDEHCRGGPKTKGDRGRIAAPSSASRPPRIPSELALLYANRRASRKQDYVSSLSLDLVEDRTSVSLLRGGSSAIEGLGTRPTRELKEEVPRDWYGFMSRRGGNSILECAWEWHGGYCCFSFRPNLDGDERLRVPQPPLPGLGRPLSGSGDGGGRAVLLPEVEFGGVGIPSVGSVSPLPISGSIVQEAIAPVMEESWFAGVAPLGATPAFFGQHKCELRRRKKMEEVNLPISDWALYARVSDSGGGESTPLATQAEEILARAVVLGLSPAPKYSFIEEWNGTDLGQPQLIELRRRAQAGEVRVVVAHSRRCWPSSHWTV